MRQDAILIQWICNRNLKKSRHVIQLVEKKTLSISAAFQISQSPIDQRSHQPCKVILRYELQYLAFGMGLHTNGLCVFSLELPGKLENSPHKHPIAIRKG